jgi:iron complex outermembrane receptor protein
MTRKLPTPIRGSAAAFALSGALVATGAGAQEAPLADPGQTVLPALTVEAGAVGLYGEEFATSAGGVMKSDTPILDTPRSVSVVTEKQMLERGARSLTEALQYTPGVVAGTGGNDNRSDWTRIRGFEPTVFLDGLQSYFGYYNNARPEPFLLGSISVLKGPSAMLYGNGAVGGIINESSKLPDPNAPNIVRLEVGSNSLFQSGIDMGGSFGEGNFLYRLVGLGRVADGPVDYSNDDAVAFAPSLTWAPTDATRITLLGSYQKNESSPYIQFLSPYGTLYSARPFGDGDRLPMDVFVGEPSFNYYDTERSAVTLFGEHRLSSVWSVAGSLRYSESNASYGQLWWDYDNAATGRYNPDGTINRAGERAQNDSHSWIGDLRATADFALGETRHAVMVGASFTDGRFNYDSGPAIANGPIDPFDPDYTGMADRGAIIDKPEYSLNQQSIYAQDRITWNDRLHFDIGLRYDWIQQEAQDWSSATPQSLDDGQLSTSLALLYAMDNGVSPYVSYSESFYQESVGTDAAGDPFDPTEGKQYEIGVKYQPVGTSLLFTAAAFEIIKSNILVADPNNPTYSVQNGEAKSRGFEVGAQGGWNDFTLDAGYAYLDTEDANDAPLVGVPENQASAWLGYAPQGGWLDGAMAGFGVRYVGETWASGVETPSVTLYDAMLGYTWDSGYQVQLTGRNLSDKTYVVSCDTSTCYYGDPRTIGLSLTAEF